MRVLRIYIQECGVFECTLIDFTYQNKAQDIICIAGVNGTGKTTVLELIFNLISLLNLSISPEDISYDRLKPNILSRVKFAQLDILIDGKILSLVIGQPSEIQKDNNSGLQQAFIIAPELGSLIFQFENTIIKPPEEEEEKIRVIKRFKEFKDFYDENNVSERSIIQKDTSIFESLISKIKEAIDTPESPTIKNLELPFIYFFNAHDREIKDIRYVSIPKEKPHYDLARRYHPNKDDINKYLVYYEYAYQNEFESLIAWINDNVLVDKYIDKIDRPNFNVLIKTKNGKHHGLELLSSGEESLLIIAIQLYLRSHKNSIFIIDEIDQSLHPEFQEKIIVLIKKLQELKKCQIIISSHSKIIWNNFHKQGLVNLTEVVL